MKLSKSKWYYRLIYQMWGVVPNNLCQFFWSLVFGIIFYIPFQVLSVLPWIISRFTKEPLDIPKWVQAIIGFICLFVSLLICFMIAMWFTSDDEIFGVGIFGWILAASVFIGYLIEKGSYKPTILTSYLKAKKQKVCPRIQWED